MLAWKECEPCDGNGWTYSGNDDPDDDGVICERCNCECGHYVEVDQDGNEI